MRNERLCIPRCGAAICLAFFGVQGIAGDSDRLLAIEPAGQHRVSDEAFHEALRQSLRGHGYTLVTAPSGVYLLLIEDDPEDIPVAIPSGGSDDVRILDGGPDASERTRTINILGDFPDSASHAIVTSALADPDARVREEAVNSLPRIDKVASIASLQLALRDPDQRVRAAAIRVITEIDAVDLLRENWAAMSQADRLAAVDAAGDTQGISATSFLEFAAEQGDAIVRQAAAGYLAER